MPKLPKRIAANASKIDIDKRYTLPEAAEGVKSCATAKFDESIDLAFYLGVDPRHAEQMVRGSVSLPHGTGKDVKVIVICKSDQHIQDAKDAGAAEVGGAELAEKISGGWTDFDALVATPDMMGQVGKLGRVLGPRGLMPSPKAGTVTADVSKAVGEIRKGKIDYRVDKNANIHVPVGKASFSPEQIRENAGSVIESVMKARPSAAKGTYMKSCTLSSTMGPGFRLDINHLSTDYSGKG
ncbi:MAG: 50S ribosomal protein L1 [Candidatus Hydrogenedentota bacterium]|nr:MAG: 50S ribosomal protein L1 [Candidatus Hydrogenedentota bacterium]